MAIFKMAKAMSAADSHIDITELAIIANEMRQFGAQDKNLLDEADAMEADEALIVLKNMTPEEKRYVCGFLAAISAVDGDVDDKEIAVWKLVSTLAQFPTMTFAEALNFWKSH